MENEQEIGGSHWNVEKERQKVRYLSKINGILKKKIIKAKQKEVTYSGPS